MVPRKAFKKRPIGKRLAKKRIGRKRKGGIRTNGGQMVVYNHMPTRSQMFVKTTQNFFSFLGTGVGISGVFAFQSSVIPDWTNLSSIYNRYLIKRIIITFTLQDTNGTSTFADNQMPTLQVRYNYDSNLVAPTSGRLQEVANVKAFTFTPSATKFQYAFYPRTISPVYLSAVASGYELQKPRYIDILYGNVPHYGLMTYIDNLSTGFNLKMDATYELLMRYES